MKTKQLIYPVFFLFSLLISASAISASYEDGRDAYQAKDYEKALSILTPMANNGHAKAQISLGVMYDFGHGVEQDPVEAIRWYEKAAEQGNSVIQHDLGVKYFKGTGIPQNYEKAAHWWNKAAENGVAESQYNLGILYTRGLGYDKNIAKAVKWYKKAASQGHAHAQYSLGVMYSFGQGVTQSYTKAASYFTDAAEQNIAQAQYNLAVLLEHGRGVEADLPRAKKWYRKAADLGVDQAAERLALLDQPQTPQDQDSQPTEKKVSDKSETISQQIAAISAPEKKSHKTDTQTVSRAAQATESKIKVANIDVEVEEIKAKDSKLASDSALKTALKKEDELTEIDKILPVGKTSKPTQQEITAEKISADKKTNTPAPSETQAPDKNDIKLTKKKVKKATHTTPQKIREKTGERDLKSLKQRQAAYVATPEGRAAVTHTTGSTLKEIANYKNKATDISNSADNKNVWIKSQNPQHYTLQMIAFREEDNATRYMENLDLEGEKAIYKSSMHGKTIYKVIYGNFANHKASLQARRNLPAKYRKTNPFPRSFEFLQNDIKE